MKIKAIVLDDKTVFGSFEQLQAEMQTSAEYDEETVHLDILVETEKGGFKQSNMEIGPNALLGVEPSVLEALVFETVEANKAHKNSKK